MSQVETPPRRREPLAVSVRKAAKPDVPQLKAVIARAFDDDPLINWMVTQDKRRARRVYDVMATVLDRIMMPHGEVYSTEGIHGAALWAPPGKHKLSALRQAMMMPAFVSACGMGRFRDVFFGMNAVEKKHPHEPHFYLGVLATDPDYQGRGVGTQLMRPVLERCDRERIPAYLESSKERNVPLYERNGFRVTEVLTVPRGGPPLWLMWRDPQ